MQLVTKRLWQSEEEMLVFVDQAGPRRRARAVYCIPRDDGRYTLGLALAGPPVNWAAFPPHIAAD
jgi:hypothetical protein